MAQARADGVAGSRWPTRTRPQRRARLGTARSLRGADGLVELIVDSGADLVLNAIVGSAGLGPTVATLGEGIDLALANKESLVVGGELVMQLARGHGRARPSGRLRALGAVSAARWREARDGRAARPDRLRRAVPRSHARAARGRLRRGCAAPPDVGDGRQDHDRLGDADEQGPRGDRGPPPFRRCLRADRRRRAPAVDRALLRTALRRRGDRAPRTSRTCACRSPTRCTIPSASTCPCARSTWSRSAR